MWFVKMLSGLLKNLICLKKMEHKVKQTKQACPGLRIEPEL